MKALTITELLCLTRRELTELHKSLSDQLVDLPEGSVERNDTLETLENIRCVLAQLEMRQRRYRLDKPTP